jgi:hypothetical protein
MRSSHGFSNVVSLPIYLICRCLPSRLLELCTDRCASHAIEAILFRVPQIVAEEAASGSAEISADAALSSGHHGSALPAGVFVDRSGSGGNGDDADDDQSPPPPPMTVLFAQFCEVWTIVIHF